MANAKEGESQNLIARVAAAIASKDRSLVKGDYEAMARAVLEAMREPTDEMHAAFMATLSWMSDTPLGNQQREAWRKENVRRWQLMIDAALNEGTDSHGPDN